MIPDIDDTSIAITPSRQITALAKLGYVACVHRCSCVDILKVGNGPVAF